MEVTVQTRLLFNVYFGLMSFDEVKARPLAAQAMTNAERLDYDDKLGKTEDTLLLA
jgi:hypothetical protein